MGTFLLFIHIIVCLGLIFVVLIQSSKGSQMGAAFGGSSQTIFGSRGAATFLSKLTTTMAIVFMLTSLLLTIIAVNKKSIIKTPPVSSTTLPESAMPVGEAGMKPAGEQQKSGSTAETQTSADTQE